MGSAVLPNASPHQATAVEQFHSDKKSMRKKFISSIQTLRNLFQSKETTKDVNATRKTKTNDIRIVEPRQQPATNVQPILSLLEGLTLDSEKENKTKTPTKEEYNEIDNFFAFKSVKLSNGKTHSSSSRSSEDSGYSETSQPPNESPVFEDAVERKDKVKDYQGENVTREAQDDAEVGVKDGKKKHSVTVYLPRKPDRKKLVTPDCHPYQNIQQINKINTQTFSGGNVIVNHVALNAQADLTDYSHIQPIPPPVTTALGDPVDVTLQSALTQVFENIKEFANYTPQEQSQFLESANEFVTEQDLAMSNEVIQSLLQLTEDMNAYENKGVSYACTDVSQVDGQRSVRNEFVGCNTINSNFQYQNIYPVNETQNMQDNTDFNYLSLSEFLINSPTDTTLNSEVTLMPNSNAHLMQSNPLSPPMSNESSRQMSNLSHDSESSFTFNENAYAAPCYELTPPSSNDCSSNSPPHTTYLHVPSNASPASHSSPMSYSSLVSPARSVTPNVFQSNSLFDGFEQSQNFDAPVFDDDDIPSCLTIDKNVTVEDALKKNVNQKTKEGPMRRTSSITMSTAKRRLAALSAVFSKKLCCQKTPTTYRMMLQEHMKNLTGDERTNVCMQITKLDTNTMYAVLQRVLDTLSSPTVEREPLHYSIFVLICEKILAQDPTLFLKDLGLRLLAAAALCCPTRPVLVGYLVHCMRTALAAQSGPATPAQPLFTEVDARGENLVGACARAGDAYADVLSLIVQCKEGERPLFNVQHANSEGYSALHTACLQHNAVDPATGLRHSCLHTAHVLIKHGRADITRGDNRGGDSPLHLAVQSASCDPEMVFCLFEHVPRPQWKRVASAPNRSQLTPLESARSAAKSPSRTNYPPEILDFLQKCRRLA